MEGIIIAVIGAIALAIPPLVSTGAAPGRRVKRLHEELSFIKDLPPEMKLELQLARYVFRESLWRYAVLQSRPVRPIPYLLRASLSLLIFYAGLFIIAPPEGDDWLGLVQQPATDEERFGQVVAGVALISIAVALYISTLLSGHEKLEQRIRRLGSPPSRARQLIAAEARQLEDVTDLGEVPIGEPDRSGEGLPMRWLRPRLTGRVWDEFDRRMTVSEASASRRDPDSHEAETD